MPFGILPSFNAFSSIEISCRLLAFLIIISTRFFSLSVSFNLTPFSPETPFVAGPLSNVLDLIPRI